jgi:Fe-S-cluster-containing dehydrogenase component
MVQLAILTDLSKCFGCNACMLACKEWHSSGCYGPMTDLNPWGPEPGKSPWSVFFLRVLHVEVGEYPNTKTFSVPISCFHCRNPACTAVCPTGAIFKRREDGVVVINYDVCIGCRYCENACPYGNITFDPVEGVAKKCVMAIDRVYDESLPEYERIPPCVRNCPAGARIFGDMDDPNSIIYREARRRGAVPLGPEYGTDPPSLYVMPGTPVNVAGRDYQWPSMTKEEEFAVRTGAADVPNILSKLKGVKPTGGHCGGGVGGPTGQGT